MLDFRTDLANERRDLYKKANGIESEIQGIETEEEKEEKALITRVKVKNKQGEEAIKKPIGTYVTIDIKDLKFASSSDMQKISEILTRELKKFIDKYVKNTSSILIVGLGNLYVTPDSLGPKVINEIDITRHVLEYMPGVLEKNTRPVSAISPGVLGTTGIETQEILKGIVQNTTPELIIIIDALISRSIERICSSIQISDTGIVPGAGIGNARKELTKESLGVQVISVGIPTVMEAFTIVTDTLELLTKRLNKDGYSNEFAKRLQSDKYEMIKEILNQNGYNLIVTPKEIDKLIENMKDIISKGINFAIN